MDRTQAERISARMALIIGFAVTLGLWTYTGYAFTRQIDRVREEAAGVTARYNQAQQLLTTVRTQVLLTSVRVRDALLAGDPIAVADNREQAEESFHLIRMAIEDYEPVVRSASEGDQILSLRMEIDRFHQASTQALGDAPGRSTAVIREVLNRSFTPRREAALDISEEIQTLNRQAYIGQQNDIADIYRTAERSSRRQLGVALALSLGILFMTSLYAGKLDERLRMQLKRDVRLSRELHDTATQLLAERAEAQPLPAVRSHDGDGDARSPG